MIAVGTQFRVLIICALSSSCATRSGPDFRILPATPNYLLRNPDSEQTPFPEILRVYNGFEPGGAWLELRPYMELRIENAYYEPGASKGGLTGFLGTEVAQYKMRLHVGLQLLSVRSMQHRPDEQFNSSFRVRNNGIGTSGSTTKFSSGEVGARVVPFYSAQMLRTGLMNLPLNWSVTRILFAVRDRQIAPYSLKPALYRSRWRSWSMVRQSI